MAATTNPPTREVGVVSNQPPQFLIGGGLSNLWGTIVDEAEHAPKLRWPQSIETYGQMLNDSQINALRLAVTLPLKRRRWLIDPNGAEDRIVRHVAGDLGLPILGDDAKPRVVDPRRFAWKKHLHHVLLAPFYGHYFFSQYAPIADDGLAHLRKLLPLPPRTISQIRVAQDGGLEWIRQYFSQTSINQYGFPDPIPVTSLVAYVWEQEAGNWFGRSMLRSCYRDWLAKDDLIRTNMVKLRRNGMGMPLGLQTEKDADGTQAKKVQAIAQAARAGEDSAATLPYGFDLVFRGVEGTVPDAVPSIKMHDEAMARAFLAMFLQLGQTQSGARALGETFVDFFSAALDAVADDGVCEPTTLFVIRDLVDWNYGEDVDLIPLLVSERDEDPELTVADLTGLIQQHAITVDDELENVLRGRYGLPALTHPRPVTAPVVPAQPAPPGGAPAPAAHVLERPAGGIDAGRMRRVWDRLRGRAADQAPDPTEHVDWQGIDQKWRDELAALIASWGDVREQQITQLEMLIEHAGGDLGVLATIAATAQGHDQIVAAMRDMADFGVQSARTEATVQGVALPDPDVEDLHGLLATRSDAIAELLARSISEAAGRQALQRTGGSLTPQEVASEVGTHLRGLSNAYLEDQLGGALTQGFNGGRRWAMRGAPVEARFAASSLLDTNVCPVCAASDGLVYASLEDAEAQFPTGGNKDCQGGPRCRCTLVGIYGEAPATVQ